MDDKKTLAQFLLLIKKMVANALRNTAYGEHQDDIVNETFIKLYKTDFFDTYSLKDEESQKIATSYIKKTIHSCFQDYLVNMGVYRRSTKHELEHTGLKTQAIHQEEFTTTSDTDMESSVIKHSQVNPEQYIFAQTAYNHIYDCFNLFLSKITDITRSDFLKEAFWEDSFDKLPLKELASHYGYHSSNPTQEFTRFVDKVSRCTEKNNIKIVKSGEQIEFLRQIISSNGVIVK